MGPIIGVVQIQGIEISPSCFPLKHLNIFSVVAVGCFECSLGLSGKEEFSSMVNAIL